jgi:hypothetical protein
MRLRLVAAVVFGVVTVSAVVNGVMTVGAAPPNDTPDQVNDPTSGTGKIGCDPNIGLGPYQSFTPTRRTLSAVDIRWGSGFVLSGPTDEFFWSSRIRIIANNPGGSVLGEATLLVPFPDGTSPVETERVAHYVFPREIRLQPGSTYLIQIVCLKGAGIWKNVASGTNPYPGGQYFNEGGIAVPNTDINFKTY